MDTVLTKEMIRAGMLGLAVGDAVGVPYEFRSKEEMDEDPAVDMVGFGTHMQPRGFWSDDTSMALAQADAMAAWEEKEDYGLVMDRFSAWYFDGEYTPGGEVFDSGITCGEAIYRYADKVAPPEECGRKGDNANGNGALMRILPALYCLHAKYGRDWVQNEEARGIVEKLTALTHNHKRAMIASVIYLSAAEELLCGKEKKEAVSGGLAAAFSAYSSDPELEPYMRLQSPGFKDTPREEMLSGGYVVETIEAAFWAFLSTDSYKDCVLKAVNLGHDTDTCAAVAGGLAGLCYGLSGIPGDWLSGLARKDLIEDVCGRLALSLGAE